MPTSPPIKKNKWGIVHSTDVHESPITRSKSYNRKWGSYWAGIFELPPLTLVQQREWRAWFASLKGQTGTFYASDPDAGLIKGTASAPASVPITQTSLSPLNNRGTELWSDNWIASGVDLLLPGDYISYQGELKMIMTAVNSSPSRSALLSVRPELHVELITVEPIVFVDPVGIFRIPEGFTDWESDEFGTHRFTFPVEEVIV